MLRSLITLLIFANLSVGSTPPGLSMPVFNPIELVGVAPIPVQAADSVAPAVEAKAALVMDLATGLVLYGKNARQPLPMASLTKIMTAVLILESHTLDETVKVVDDFKGLEGVRMWLRKYERMTVENLLMGLLIPSAGDAAIALATHHSGSVPAFVQEMNRKAIELGLKNTHFTNPVGLDEEGHFSTAYDLAILTKRALRDPSFRRIVQIAETGITSQSGFSYYLKNTNKLLGGYLDIRGVKTGTTDEAGASLISLAVSPDGHEVLAVLLNSPSRFQENKGIIDWVFRNYFW
ncbi:D-alanyl-D-alanine carboxypeptidase [Candidatus Peregrinibacteria bacterium]|nr:D-alanyl-D-alanine carboxypeptidase [Candidatus Peregrinibacteria bacterium]